MALKHPEVKAEFIFNQGFLFVKTYSFNTVIKTLNLNTIVFQIKDTNVTFCPGFWLWTWTQMNLPTTCKKKAQDRGKVLQT